MDAKELKTKSSKELLKKIDDLKAELFTLRFQNSTNQLDQPHKIKLIKRDIARIFTLIAHLKIQSTSVKRPKTKLSSNKKLHDSTSLVAKKTVKKHLSTKSLDSKAKEGTS